MKVLVSGAGGFLGRHVVDRLVRKGHGVRAIIRPESCKPDWPNQVEIFRADLRVHDGLVSAFEGIDVVIHLAAATTGDEDIQFASTVVGTERFLDAMAKSSVKRLVHISSLVVYDWTKAKRILDENTPLLTTFIYDMGPYTVAKIWQERIVTRFSKKHAWALTLLRPGFIWGPEHEAIAGMGRRFGRLYIMFGPFTRLPLCHVVNCADCIVSVTERSSAVGQTFNVIDGDEVRVWRYVAEIARRVGPRGALIPIPYRLGLGIAQLASLVSRALFGKKGRLPSLLMPRRFEWQFKPIKFSNHKLQSVLKWTPTLKFEQCLTRPKVTHQQHEKADRNEP